MACLCGFLFLENDHSWVFHAFKWLSPRHLDGVSPHDYELPQFVACWINGKHPQFPVPVEIDSYTKQAFAMLVPLQLCLGGWNAANSIDQRRQGFTLDSIVWPRVGNAASYCNLFR